MRIFLLFVHLFNTLKPHHAALAKERVRFNLYMYIKTVQLFADMYDCPRRNDESVGFLWD